jgi:nucleoside-diphosphate-sugar epimerase
VKILITGNMGYVGPSVVAHLRASYPQAQLFGLDMGYYAHCLTGVAAHPERHLDAQHLADVRKTGIDVLAGMDAVVHLAAISNDPMGNAFESVTMDINQHASIRLARLAKEAGVKRFVFASSCSMYGYAEGGPRHERDALNPLTAYARSKVGTEEGLQQLASNEFIVTSLRFATACGMSDRLRLDLVLNDFVAGALTTGEISILSDGTPWRPLIHVRDMARAVDWAIERDVTLGPFFVVNAGSDEWNYQVRELAEAVARAIPGTSIAINTNAAPDRRSYRVSFQRYRDVAPRHQPQIDLEKTIADLRDGLQHMKFSDSNFRQSAYIRLHTLSNLRQRELLDENLKWRIPAPFVRSQAPKEEIA